MRDAMSEFQILYRWDGIENPILFCDSLNCILSGDEFNPLTPGAFHQIHILDIVEIFSLEMG